MCLRARPHFTPRRERVKAFLREVKFDMSAHQSLSKVTPDHLARFAAVYIRQSTQMQLVNNTASTARQYNMANLARQYGWADDRIKVIDKDQGLSGTSIDWREGFKELLADIILGHVGAVFAVEASRLARDSADWQQLVKLCTYTNTLIVDESGVHDPRAFDDKLLLDVKGLFGAIEDYIIKSRLRGGALTRAREGKLRFRLPPGYVHSPSGEIVIDPDETIQERVLLLFEQFEILGSAFAVVRHFRTRNILFPTTFYDGAFHAEYRMKPLYLGQALRLLHNPIYAGMYVYGKTKMAPRPVRDGETIRLKTCYVRLEPDEWQVVLRGAHEAYITEEQYERIERRLRENCFRQNPDGAGAARRGTALLQGIARCGVCGNKMYVRYQGRKNEPYYQCRHRRRYGDEMQCVFAPARRVDPLVRQCLLEALAPARIEAALSVIDRMEADSRQEVELARSRVKEARGQARRTENLFKQAAQTNERVREKLEGEWEEALKELEGAERDLSALQSSSRDSLRADERESLLALLGDLPDYLESPTTSQQDWKELLRMMIKEVRLLRGPGVVKAAVRWEGGGQRQVEGPWPSYPDSHSTDTKVVDTIRYLAPTHTDKEIAAYLNGQGLRPLRAEKFGRVTVAGLRMCYGIPNGNTRKPPFRFKADGRITLTALAVKAGRSRASVVKWCKREGVDMVRPAHNSPFWVKISDEEITRLKQAIRPRRSKNFSQVPSS